jgi:hypothetical protein
MSYNGIIVGSLPTGGPLQMGLTRSFSTSG